MSMLRVEVRTIAAPNTLRMTWGHVQVNPGAYFSKLNQHVISISWHLYGPKAFCLSIHLFWNDWKNNCVLTSAGISGLFMERNPWLIYFLLAKASLSSLNLGFATYNPRAARAPSPPPPLNTGSYWPAAACGLLTSGQLNISSAARY